MTKDEEADLAEFRELLEHGRPGLREAAWVTMRSLLRQYRERGPLQTIEIAMNGEPPPRGRSATKPT